MKIATFFALSLSLLLVSCADYAINVNEKTVYNPLGVFTDFKVADLALQRCIDQTIKEERVRTAKDLKSLLCPEKSIETLSGLAIFTELKVLGLEGNPLKDIEVLNTLKHLEQLNLKNTGISALTSLKEGPKLSYLNIEGNPKLNCETLVSVRFRDGAQVLKPQHCL